jgi:hypothetical protein
VIAPFSPGATIDPFEGINHDFAVDGTMMMARMPALALFLGAWVRAASAQLPPMDHVNNLDWTALIGLTVP